MKGLIFPLVLMGLVIAFAVGCQENGHDHDHPHPHESAFSVEPTSKTVFGGKLLLFLEYPRPVQGKSGRFLAHLSVLATGEPVRAGSVSLEIGGSPLSVDSPKREGLFLPEGSLTKAGNFPSRLIVRSDQAAETLDLGEMIVYASEDEAARAAESEAESEPPGAVPFLMEQQWKLRLLLGKAEARKLSRRLVVPAQAAAPEGSMVVVTSSLGGRLIAPQPNALPKTGDTVEAGKVLGLVEPPLNAPELAQLRALDLEFDLKALDVLKTTGEAEARLRFAERERERMSRLRPEGLSTQQQLDQAEQNLAVARNEAEAAARMKESLDRLVASRADKDKGNFATIRSFPVTAPIGGHLVEVRHVEGEAVGANEALFRILDSSRIWIEGRVSEFDLAAIGASPKASVSFAALPGKRFELLQTSSSKPYVGQEVDTSSRTLLLRFEMQNPAGAIRPGMMAELEIATGEIDAAVAIPAAAIVMDQGVPTTYVMLEGELFQKRELELGIKDGDWVEVKRGLNANERVATRGAYVVKLAALSPTSFGPGHAH